MGIFEQFPYTNFHDLNLDWILRAIKSMDKKLDEFVASNVLSYADPIQWDIETQYAKNTVVVDPKTGTAYMSINPVPVGQLLTNKYYWQTIFNYDEIVNTLKKQIAAVQADPHDIIPIPCGRGDLVWIANKLYRLTKSLDAGSKIIENENAVPVTVEEIVKDIDAQLIKEISVRESADTTITNNLNKEISDRESADTALQQTIDDNYELLLSKINVSGGIYVSASSLGLDKTGSTDSSGILSGLANNVGLDAGTYLIASNCTISKQIALAEGAIIKVNSGVTLTITGTITAGRYQIFSGDGNVKLLNFADIPVEWFGASVNNSDNTAQVQKAFNSILSAGVISFAPSENNSEFSGTGTQYIFSKPVILSGSHWGIEGNFATIVSAGNVFEYEVGDYQEETFIRDFYLFNSAPLTGTAIKISNCTRMNIEHIYTFYYAVGFDINGSVNLRIRDCKVNSIATGSRGSIYGFKISGINASIRLEDCHANDSGHRVMYGFWYESAIVKDFIFDKCECAGCFYGIYINVSSGTQEAYDCFITNCIIDGCVRCITVTGAGANTLLNIVNNWCDIAGTSSALNGSGVEINDSYLINILHNEIKAVSEYVYGVVSNRGIMNNISDNLIVGCKYPISATGNYAVIKGNVIRDSQNYTPPVSMPWAINVSGSYSSIFGNIAYLEQSITNAISLTGNNCKAGFNQMNATNLYNNTGNNNTLLDG